MIPDVPGYAKERPRWPSEVGPAGALLCRGGQDEGLPGSGGGGGSAVTGWRVSAPVSTVPAAGCRRTALATSSATLAGSAPATCTWMVGDGSTASSGSSCGCLTVGVTSCRTNGARTMNAPPATWRACSSSSEEHTSELQSPVHLVCRLLPEKKKQREPVVGDRRQRAVIDEEDFHPARPKPGNRLARIGEKAIARAATLIFFLMNGQPLVPILFPYTTLFR